MFAEMFDTHRIVPDDLQSSVIIIVVEWPVYNVIEVAKVANRVQCRAAAMNRMIEVSTGYSSIVDALEDVILQYKIFLLLDED